MAHGNEISWHDSKGGLRIKISFRFIISFVIISLFQMNFLKLLLILKKSKCVPLYLMIEGEKIYTLELEMGILLLWTICSNRK